MEKEKSRLEKSTITRDEINRLPLLKFKGPIHLIKSKQSASRAVERLKQEAVVGFDTETRPSFKKGVIHPPALAQFATRTDAWLFRLKSIGIHSGLLDLFQDPHTVKIGLALHDDIKHLQRLKPFQPRGFLDLAKIAQKAKFQKTGLRNMTGILLGSRLSKRVQLSNWSKPVLSSNQMTYAATDAWVSLLLFQEFQKIGLLDSTDSK